MTDYSDGNWHGWNGGDCPVHPNTVVEVTWSDGDNWSGEACLNVWNVVQLFRVVKRHKEPREFWIDVHGFAYDNPKYAKSVSPFWTPIHVREVLDD